MSSSESAALRLTKDELNALGGVTGNKTLALDTLAEWRRERRFDPTFESTLGFARLDDMACAPDQAADAPVSLLTLILRVVAHTIAALGRPRADSGPNERALVVAAAFIIQLDIIEAEEGQVPDDSTAPTLDDRWQRLAHILGFTPDEKEWLEQLVCGHSDIIAIREEIGRALRWSWYKEDIYPLQRALLVGEWRASSWSENEQWLQQDERAYQEHRKTFDSYLAKRDSLRWWWDAAFRATIALILILALVAGAGIGYWMQSDWQGLLKGAGTVGLAWFMLLVALALSNWVSEIGDWHLNAFAWRHNPDNIIRGKNRAGNREGEEYDSDHLDLERNSSNDDLAHGASGGEGNEGSILEHEIGPDRHEEVV